MKKLCVVFSALLVCSLMSFGQQEERLEVRVLFTGATMATVSGDSNPVGAVPGRLFATANNRLYFSNSSDPDNTEIFVVYSITPQDFVKISDTRALRAKVDAANSTAAQPTVMTVQALDLDSSGNLIVLTDGPDPEAAYLFSINPQTQAIKLLSGLDGPAGRSSIEGASSMTVMDTRVFITLNEFFGAVRGDSIVVVDTGSPDGGATAATELVSAARLETALKAKQEAIALNDIAVRPLWGTLVAINSGSAEASDDLLEIDPWTGDVSVLVAATDIESDLGVTDVGFSAIEVGPRDVIILVNAFGAIGDFATRGIIAIKNASAGQGTASLYASELEITTRVEVQAMNGGPVAQLGFVNAGLAIHPITGEVFFSETDPRNPAAHTNGVIGVRRIAPGPPPPPPPDY